MSREWKPGDVAVASCRSPFDSGFVDEHLVFRAGEKWLCSMTHYRESCHSIADLRPLVVIDPEDREQLCALADGFTMAEDPRALAASENRINALKAALRSLLAPEKPPEPQMWLAAVLDADGNRWARNGGPTDGRNWYSPDLNTTRAYADIAAVRVLSEGVTA